jgi:DNA-directed RNA polymerase specialized sigma24 family protein
VNRWDEIWDAEYFGHASELALAEVKRKVSPKQYQIFHLYCIKQHDVKQIARMLDVSPNEVYLAKNRVQPLFEEATRNFLAVADTMQAA